MTFGCEEMHRYFYHGYRRNFLKLPYNSEKVYNRCPSDIFMKYTAKIVVADIRLMTEKTANRKITFANQFFFMKDI